MSQSIAASPVEPRLPVATVVVGAWTVIVAALTILGADLMWVVAMGDHIRAGGDSPDGIPFASGPQVNWHNPIQLAQVLLSMVHGWGGAGLAALQTVLVAGTLLVVVSEGRRLGGGEKLTATVVSLVVVGAASALFVTRLPSLSLVPFVLAAALMRRQHSRPGRGIWWLVPLYIVWGNLHGAVLVGLAVLGVFLLVSRSAGSFAQRLGLALGCALSLVLTSAGTKTPAYYLGALANEAATRRTDLWAAPRLSDPLDLAMILVSFVLIVLAARKHPPLWEGLAALGLMLGMISAARHGVWLILFLAPAALRRTRATAVPRTDRMWVTFVGVTVVASLLGASWQLSRRLDAVAPPGSGVVRAVEVMAGGRPVLADEPLAETLAQRGVTVWASNPIDAFSRPVQRDFLDFLHDGEVPPSGDFGLVVVSEARAPLISTQGWTDLRTIHGYVVLERTGTRAVSSAP